MGILTCAFSVGFALPGSAFASPSPAHVPGELLVGFKSGADRSDRGAIRRHHRAKLERTFPVRGLQLVKLPKGTSVRAAAKSFKRDAGVRYAVPNAIYQPATIPNDPKFGEQWGLHNTGQYGGVSAGNGIADSDIDAPEAWDTTTGSPGVTVAVVDSGVDVNHPDLAPNIWQSPGETGSGKETNGIDDDGNGKIDDWRGWDFIQNDNDPRDFLGHGTAVAGALGARGNDGIGLAGVSWQSKIMPIRASQAAELIAGFGYAAANGAKVVNASVVCRGNFSGDCSESALASAINAAPNTLFVTAAGNDAMNNDSLPAWPCNVNADNLICVGASDRRDNFPSFSAYGSQTVDLAAPGKDVNVAQPIWANVFTENFESDITSTWTTGGTDNTWARSNEAHQGPGSYSLDDSPGANYVVGTDSFAKKVDPIDLTGRAGCRLQWNYKLDVRTGAIVRAEVSTDGSNWTQMSGIAAQNNGFGFKGKEDDLSSFDGQSVYLRFHFTSHPSYTSTGDGVHIDNVAISCLGTDYGASQFDYALNDGTSIAAPHVSGAAALLWANTPAASVSSVKSALLNTVDIKPGFSKLATSGRLNVWRALHYAPPATPTLTGTSPATNSNNNLPKIKGHAPAGTTVLLYTNGGCSGSPTITGPEATFSGVGLQAFVNDNTTTPFRARAFSDTGGISNCSSAIEYKEKTPKQKKDPIISSYGTVGSIKEPAFAFGGAGIVVDRNSGWSVSQTGKVALSSANSQVIQDTLAVQPGACPAVGLGTTVLKAVAFFDEETNYGNCLSDYTSARFGSVTTDDTGKQVAFSANFPFQFGSDAAFDTPQVYLWKGDKVTEVTTGTADGVGSAYPTLSGDGKQLVFVSTGDYDSNNTDANMELFSYNTANKHITQLTDTQDCSNVGYAASSILPGISISGNGNRMVFQSNCDLGGHNPNHDFNIFVYDRISGTFSMMQGCDICTGGFTLIDTLSISADGNTVANYYGHFNNGIREYMVVRDLDPTTGAEANFQSFGPIANDFGGGEFEQKFSAPALSADGKRIAYSSQDNPVGKNPDGMTEIFLMDRRPVGNEIRQLTDTHSSSGQSAPSAGQTMNAKGDTLYLRTEGQLFGKKHTGVYRLKLKPAAP